MKVQVAVLGSPSLMVLMVSVDVNTELNADTRVQELCESRSGRPGLPVPNSRCGHKATLN